MPKISHSKLPVSALFGLVKPSGPTSMSVINDVKKLLARSRLFVSQQVLDKNQKIHKRGKRSGEIVKIGQGGTLDPLADGVLVVGVGKGTKKLSEFLDCVKEYKTTCLLGCETDTYDSQGKRVRVAPWKHITQEDVERALGQFSGQIEQAPPIFSALKMDGKPLHQYAREGIPLPRPIEKRPVTVHSLELVEWLGTNHNFAWPKETFTEAEKEAMTKALKGIDAKAEIKDDENAEETQEATTAFVLKMKVSGGTYVRSIVHDLAHAVGSAGHVVTLQRSRQGRFVLEKGDETDEGVKECIPWDVLERAIRAPGEADEDGWVEWERAVLERMEIVDE